MRLQRVCTLDIVFCLIRLKTHSSSLVYGKSSGLDNIFQLQDERQIGEITLPWVVSRTESHRELRVACGQSGLHIMLYNVPKNTHSIFSSKLFAAQQNGLLCDMTVVFEEE